MEVSRRENQQKFQGIRTDICVLHECLKPRSSPDTLCVCLDEQISSGTQAFLLPNTSQTELLCAEQWERGRSIMKHAVRTGKGREEETVSNNIRRGASLARTVCA